MEADAAQRPQALHCRRVLQDVGPGSTLLRGGEGPPLTGQRLYDALERMNPRKALGPDSWSVAELRGFTAAALQPLAELLNTVERTVTLAPAEEA